MKPSLSQWTKACKALHSMSDVITAAYVNQTPTEDLDDDFGTADLSEGVKDTEWVVKLPIGISINGVSQEITSVNGVSYGKYFRAGDRIVHEKPLEKSCTCGAQKTYGPTCSRSFHSSWCDLK